MITVSNDFKSAMKNPVKELSAYIKLDEDTKITDADDLISFKITCESGLCKTSMRKIEAKYLGDYNLLGNLIHAGFGVRLSNGEFEYIDYGSFLVTEISFSKDTEETTIKGYDLMIHSMVNYNKLNVQYPIGLYNYTKILCNSFGVELGNDSFNVHNNWQVTQDLWENINGITYRDILQQIAQVTCSTCIISNDKVYFKPITSTNETLTYDNLFKLKLEPIYGEINSVVLSRTPQEDNIYMRDEESIETNGLTEFKIENNEIVDKNRDEAMTQIYNGLHGISYYPFEMDTEGLGWYEIGDSFDIKNNSNDIFNTTLFNFSITIDGGIEETLKTTAETKTQTQYQYATTISKRVKNVEIITNKQEGYIEQLVTDMYEEDGVINENFTNVYQDINNIINSVQRSGGNNLIKNSVMFAYDNNNKPNDWECSNTGTLNIFSDTESITAGCLSGHSFSLLDKNVKQRVNVKPYNETDIEKTYYTFSTKIKKDVVGSCYIKISNSNEEYLIELNSGESSYYGDYEIPGLLPKDNYYDIELYGSADSNATFTDCMFSLGEYKTQWTQASGEIMNTQVNITVDGVLVKSSVYLGDYTVMSPLEFAGYSNINGTITKVFTVNKDTTEVEKLKAKKEIAMTPIKVVPITTGDTQGWAFVPSAGGDN